MQFEFEVVTLFVGDIVVSRAFYQKALNPEIVYEDEVSCVMRLGAVMVNLLAQEEAPQLVEPLPVGPEGPAARSMMTLRVTDVDSAYSDLMGRGVTFLNGPIDRAWGRRTAAFADPSGHIWEIAQEI